MRKEAGLRAWRTTFYFTRQDCTNTRQSDQKLGEKAAGLRAQCSTFSFTRQHCTNTKQLNRKLVRKEAGLKAWCTTLCSTSQHRTHARQSDQKLVRNQAGAQSLAHNPPSGCPSADLIKADGVDSATDVDAARGNAVDVLGHQAALSKDDSHGQSSRQGGGHSDCHQVKGTNNDVAH